MATTTEKLTFPEFEKRYLNDKPYYEFWHGEAFQKSMPTWVHGLLQRIVMDLLSRAGYKSAPEVKLNIDPEFQLIPDVIATRGRIELPYPARALEVVIEILSESDTMSRTLSKCRAYQGWGFEQIYVLDPDARVVFRWEANRLQEVDTFAGMPAQGIWEVLDQQLQ
jgi:Uma2 family endonuclease